VKDLDEHMKRLIAMNNCFANQAAQTHHLIMKHDKDIQINGMNSLFQKEFMSQFVSPVCQAIVEIIPSLVKQKTLNGRTLLCPSLTDVCAKLSNRLHVLTNKFPRTK
jgi:hypothetical protein